jgi:hypothetical protein
MGWRFGKLPTDFIAQIVYFGESNPSVSSQTGHRFNYRMMRITIKKLLFSTVTEIRKYSGMA